MRADSPLRLIPLTAEHCEAARTWRLNDDVRGGLRTPYPLTQEMQADFYRRVVCDRASAHRYWGVARGDDTVDALSSPLVAMVGLTNISWESGDAEISLVVSPEFRRGGRGTASVALALAEGFGNMRLVAIWGECYHSNEGGLRFWNMVVERYKAHAVELPYRKYWEGKFHPSTIFTITEPMWRYRPC